jgi:lipid-binding SYLF domain-containing protein
LTQHKREDIAFGRAEATLEIGAETTAALSLCPAVERNVNAMIKFRTSIVALGLVLLSLSGGRSWAGYREAEATVDAAAEAVQTIAGVGHKGFPPAVLREAAGIVVCPHVVKGGVVFDGRFGRGVLLVHQADGTWGRPVFVTLSGSGVGLQAGIESAEVVLVFRTGHSLERVLKGKSSLKLGGDVAIAVGPVGVEAEAAATLRKAEVYSYTRERGLFAGVSLEGDRLQVDGEANEAFYGRHCRQAADVFALREVRACAGAERLREHLGKLGTPPAPAPVIVLPQAPPPPLRRP